MVLISRDPVQGAEIYAQGRALRSGEGNGWREADHSMDRYDLRAPWATPRWAEEG